MDVNTDLPEVQRGEPDGENLPHPGEPGKLRFEDLHPLVIRSIDQVEELYRKYKALAVPKDDEPLFMQHLTQRRDAWFIEAGDLGLIYLTDIILHVDARLHVVFWDGHLTQDRREAVKTTIRTGMNLFDLRRISAATAESNQPMRQMLRKVGFTIEGVLRQSWQNKDGSVQNAYFFGILREELPPCLELSMTSSVPGI